jgi:hypothetical protein
VGSTLSSSLKLSEQESEPKAITPAIGNKCRRITMNYRTFFLRRFTFVFILLLPLSGQSQSEKSDLSASNIVLVKAVMCEDILGLTPQNATTVFSIERRKAICFTSFDSVSEQTDIYHRWFHKDRPSAKIKLTLKPPRWSTYSSIQLRAEDLGPWRVEVTDSKGRVFQILRFSITE